jgi:hypothetical protein
MFCNAWKQYGDYPQVRLPDGRIEVALGDLVSGEERYVVLMLESRTSSHLVRIQGTQNDADVVRNVELIAVIANQQAADAVRKAAEALAGGADAATALGYLSKAKVVLEACPAPQLTSEAAALLDEHEQKIRSQEMDSRSRKSMLYEARYYGQTSSARLYTGSRQKSEFTKKPTADEQLNEKPSTDTRNSSGEQQLDSENEES